jgi:hypothetical protein
MQPHPPRRPPPSPQRPRTGTALVTRSPPRPRRAVARAAMRRPLRLLLAAAALLAAAPRRAAARAGALDRAEAFIGYAERTAPPGGARGSAAAACTAPRRLSAPRCTAALSHATPAQPPLVRTRRLPCRCAPRSLARRPRLTQPAPPLRSPHPARRAGPRKPGCTDRDAGCAGWVASGECTKNPGFMAGACALSCNACPPPATGPAAALTGPAGAPWAGDTLVIATSLGDIRVQLRPALAPKTVAYIRSLASPGGPACSACRFYRAEALPAPGAVDNFGGPGPPYALIQGSLASPGFAPIDKEAAPLVQRGDACFIGSGPDFFIAVGPHPEWGTGHTVWGRVEPGGMATVDEIGLRQPKKEETWGETHVTVLVTPLPFTLRLEPGTGG